MKTSLLIIIVSVGFLLSITLPYSEAMRMVWNLDQMIERSDVIVIGTIESTWIDVRPFDDHHVIIDTAKIKVDEWFIDPIHYDTLEIRYYGYWAKTIDDMRGVSISDNPTHSYETGQKVLVLATYEKPTMVMGEGYYPFYEGGYVIKDTIAISQTGEQMKLADLYNVIKNQTKSKKIVLVDDSVYSRPYVNDDDLIDNLKKNQLPIGQGVYMNFTFLLVIISGVIIGIIFVIKRKRK